MLRPMLTVNKYSDLSAAMLLERGLCALLLDLDGTLVPSKEPHPNDDLIAWARLIQAEGIKIFILSNNKRPSRVLRFADAMGCGCMHLARKPAKRGFLSALAVLGTKPSQTALLGDQIFTDVLGASRAGIYPIRVESIDTDLWYFGLRRVLEIGRAHV